MMTCLIDIFQAGLFGLVQGLTEFLPISSSGHLVVLHSIANLRLADDLAFDVALHLGTAVALVCFFRRDIARLLRSWLAARPFHDQPESPDSRLAWFIIIGTIPAAIAGLLWEDAINQLHEHPGVVGVTLILAGLALWLVDRTSQAKEPDKLGWGSALLIGLGQALALIPGVSRSGATITAGRLVGLGRVAAARYSFLLSIPIVLAAGVKELWQLDWSGLNDQGSWIFITGTIVSALVGIGAIKFLLRFVSRHSYKIFVIYRLVLGAAILLWIYV